MGEERRGKTKVQQLWITFVLHDASPLRSSDVIVLSDEEETDGPNSKHGHPAKSGSSQLAKPTSNSTAQAGNVDTNSIREKLLEEERKLTMLKALKNIQKQDTTPVPNGRVTAFSKTHTIATVPIQGSALNKTSAKSRLSAFEHSLSARSTIQSKIVVVPGNLKPSSSITTSVTSSATGTGISSRLQQLVDNVAVNQALPSDRNLQRLASSLGKTRSLSPPVLSTLNTKSIKPSHEIISLTTTRSQPPPLLPTSQQVSTTTKGGSIQVSTISSTTGNKNLAILALAKDQSERTEAEKQHVKLAVETSKRYRDFVLKQAHSKRSFMKQLERKILISPYPKTFRQVWPIIPVHDSSFIPNFGLEGVVEHFQSSTKSQTPKAPPKVKPVCNQCNCDFASAWQIRKGNSKQLLLCEACDFQNLKILQRSKLSNQLKELLESVRKEEEQFNQECEESKKQVIELEKQSLLSLHKPLPLNTQQTSVVTTNVIKNVPKVSSHSVVVDGNKVSANGNQQHPVIPSILGQRHHAPELLAIDEIVRESRKRKDTSGVQPPPSKSFKPGSALDQTLNKLSESLIKRKLDEQRLDSQPEQPLKAEPVPMEISDVPNSVTKTPVVMDTKSISAAESRKNRRKGTPKHKRLLSSSSATGE